MTTYRATKPFLDSAQPLAISHRGFSPEGLENSIEAFQAAVDLGYRYMETDINTTADGVTVVFHDPTLEGITDQSGVVAQLPYSVVSQARIGGKEPIPTLDEFVQALPKALFNIDVKDAGSVQPLIDTIEKYGLHERVCVASFSEKRRRQVLAGLSKPVASSPGMSLVAAYFLLSPWLPTPLLRRLVRDIDVLQIPTKHSGVKLTTEANIRRAHKLGLKIHVWTINDATQMHELFDLGVDGIMSDRADLLAEVMHQRGYWT